MFLKHIFLKVNQLKCNVSLSPEVEPFLIVSTLKNLMKISLDGSSSTELKQVKTMRHNNTSYVILYNILHTLLLTCWNVFLSETNTLMWCDRAMWGLWTLTISSRWSTGQNGSPPASVACTSVAVTSRSVWQWQRWGWMTGKRNWIHITYSLGSQSGVRGPPGVLEGVPGGTQLNDGY